MSICEKMTDELDQFFKNARHYPNHSNIKINFFKNSYRNEIRRGFDGAIEDFLEFVDLFLEVVRQGFVADD